jgi:hypothetical protein
MTIPLETPFACQLTGQAFAARRQEILDILLPQVKEGQALPDGYAFRFPNSEEVARQLLDFILAERQCCPFLQMELIFAPDSGPTWLHLRGGDEIKRFVETEMVAFIEPQIGAKE